MHYLRAPHMPSFKRFSHMFLGFSLLTAGAIIGGACSVKLSSDFVAGATGANEVNDLAGTGATSGGDTSRGVFLPPPDTAAKASSFMYLCGDGCMSGDKSISCSLPTNPDNPPNSSCQIVATDSGPAAEC